VVEFFIVRFLEVRSTSFLSSSGGHAPFSPSVSGAPAAFHGGAVSRWSARGFHAPGWFFCLGLRVMATNRLFSLCRWGWW